MIHPRQRPKAIGCELETVHLRATAFPDEVLARRKPVARFATEITKLRHLGMSLVSMSRHMAP